MSWRLVRADISSLELPATDTPNSACQRCAITIPSSMRDHLRRGPPPAGAERPDSGAQINTRPANSPRREIRNVPSTPNRRIRSSLWARDKSRWAGPGDCANGTDHRVPAGTSRRAKSDDRLPTRCRARRQVRLGYHARGRHDWLCRRHPGLALRRHRAHRPAAADRVLPRARTRTARVRGDRGADTPVAEGLSHSPLGRDISIARNSSATWAARLAVWPGTS